MRRNVSLATRAARRLLLTGGGEPIPPPVPWSPSDLPGLLHWWDASTASNGGDGGLLTHWTDRQSGVSAMQSTGPALPVYKYNAGKPSLLFDGTDDALTTSALVTLPQPFTALVIARRGSATGLRNLWASDTTVFLRSQNAVPLAFAGSILQDSVRTVAAGQWFCMAAVFAGSASVLRYCGAQVSGSPGTGGIGPSGIVTLGGKFTADGGSHWGGDLAQILFCSGSVPLTNIAQFEALAAAQYGVSLL